MLGLIPLIFIGRWYYQLAHEYNKSRWGIAILGVGIALFAQIFFLFFAGVIAAATNNLQWLDVPIVLTLLAIGFAVIWVVITYYLLKRSWTRKVDAGKSHPNLLDS